MFIYCTQEYLSLYTFILPQLESANDTGTQSRFWERFGDPVTIIFKLNFIQIILQGQIKNHISLLPSLLLI